MLTPANGFMKLLHIGNDRELADRLANALEKAGQDVNIDWVGRIADAMRRVCDHRDIGAVIIEDPVQHQGSAGFVREVRGLGFTEPIVVVFDDRRRAATCCAQGRSGRLRRPRTVGPPRSGVDGHPLAPSDQGPDRTSPPAMPVSRRCRPRARLLPRWAARHRDRRAGSGVGWQRQPGTCRCARPRAAAAVRRRARRARPSRCRHLRHSQGRRREAAAGPRRLHRRVGRGADRSRAPDGRRRLCPQDQRFPARVELQDRPCAFRIRTAEGVLRAAGRAGRAPRVASGHDDGACGARSEAGKHRNGRPYRIGT